MDVTTSAYLKGPIWAETLDRLKGTVFETYWEIYALCISIGMMYDRQIDSDDMVPEGYLSEACEVPHTVLGKSKNAALLGFMLQTALITTRQLDYDEQTRLEYAFDDKKTFDKPIYFLTKYANYGVTLIHEIIAEKDDIEMLEALMVFLNTMYESGADLVWEDGQLREDFES